MKTNNTTTAVIVWNDTVAAEVKELILSGYSVSKAQAAAAPKGFLKMLRDGRRIELAKNSTFLQQQLSEKGFTTITRLTAEKSHKDGSKSVTLELRTKPVDASAIALAAAQAEIEALRAQLAMASK